MRIAWLQLLILLLFTGSALAVPHLTLEQFIPLFGIPMLICILCGWVLTFQSGGMRSARSLREHLLFGLLVPVPSNWIKPVPLAWPAQVMLVSAAVPAGAIARLMWIVYA
jgi:hypothetical protein